MFRSLAIRAGLLCLAIALAPLATMACAQMKIGVVNTQQAMLDSDELKKASAELEKKYKPRQDELQKLQTDLQSIQQQIGSGKLNQQAVADLQAQGTAQTARRAAHLRRSAGGRRSRPPGYSRQDGAEDAGRGEETGGGKGLRSGVDVSQTLYFKPALDLTADALAAYNKAYPGEIARSGRPCRAIWINTAPAKSSGTGSSSARS